MDTRILKTLLVSRMAQRKLRSMTLSKTIHQWLITQLIRTNSRGVFLIFVCHSDNNNICRIITYIVLYKQLTDKLMFLSLSLICTYTF